jgi:phage terminase Nu1 subunit (DNA packaging protein)
LTERSVSDLAKRGVVVKVGARGFDLRVSNRGYAEHIRAVASGRGGDAAATAVAERGLLAKWVPSGSRRRSCPSRASKSNTYRNAM